MDQENLRDEVETTQEAPRRSRGWLVFTLAMLLVAGLATSSALAGSISPTAIGSYYMEAAKAAVGEEAEAGKACPSKAEGAACSSKDKAAKAEGSACSSKDKAAKAEGAACSSKDKEAKAEGAACSSKDKAAKAEGSACCSSKKKSEEAKAEESKSDEKVQVSKAD